MNMRDESTSQAQGDPSFALSDEEFRRAAKAARAGLNSSWVGPFRPTNALWSGVGSEDNLGRSALFILPHDYKLYSCVVSWYEEKQWVSNDAPPRSIGGHWRVQFTLEGLSTKIGVQEFEQRQVIHATFDRASALENIELFCHDTCQLFKQ